MCSSANEYKATGKSGFTASPIAVFGIQLALVTLALSRR